MTSAPTKILNIDPVIPKRLSKDIDRVIASPQQIHQCIRTLAQKIHRAYRDTEDIIALVLMNGAGPFAVDLERVLNDPRFRFCPLRVSSYHGTQSSGHIQMDSLTNIDITGRHVLIVEDIYDTGLTLTRVMEHLHQHAPANVKICILFEKKNDHVERISPDFIGMSVPDAFLVGYGLDFHQRYRELNCVGILKPAILEQEHPQDAPQSVS